MRFLHNVNNFKKLTIGSIFLKCFGYLVIFFLLLPLLVLISVSFTKTGFVKFPPVGFTFKWYLEFLRDFSYIQSILFSLQLAISATLIVIGIGIPVSLALTRYRFKGSEIISFLFLGPLIFPQIVIGASIVEFLSYLGLVRSFAGLLFAHVVIVLPYVIRTVTASLVGFNISLEEAGQDLGANRIQTFFLITLPLIKGGVIAGSLFAFVMSWINIEVSMFLATSAFMPISVKIFHYVDMGIDPMIAAVSATTIYIALVMVLIIDFTVGLEKVTRK